MKDNDSIAAVLRLAREIRPDLWARVDQVARLIDPAAFADDWVITGRDAESQTGLMAARLGVQRAVAMEKAQRVLAYLGVNTDPQWQEILTRIAIHPTEKGETR